jgi:arginyl-tRNA synthetase
VEVAGPGFINFYLSDKFFTNSLLEILEQKDNFGKSLIGQGKKAIVEYSSPNIAKPFTVGHLRSTIIGDAVAKLLTAGGYEVIRDNHLGDWGRIKLIARSRSGAISKK